MNIFVGNLTKDVTDFEFQDLFEKYGKLRSAKLIRDMYSGDPRGFGFVEFENKSDAIKAIQELDGKEFKGQNLKVNEARPREDKNKRGGGRGGNRGRSGGQRRY